MHPALHSKIGVPVQIEILDLLTKEKKSVQNMHLKKFDSVVILKIS